MPALSKIADVLSQLGKLATPRPASTKDLAKLEAARAPSDLVSLYKWGANLDTLPTVDEAPGWLALPDAVSELAALRKLEWFPRTLFPLATDGAGNFACLDIASGRVVDWDHETREVGKLAPSLADYVQSQLLRGAEQRARLAAQEAKERKRGAVSSAEVAAPKKLTQIPRTDLRKLDSRGYSGGASSAIVLTGSRVFLGTQNGSYVVDLNGRTNVDLGHGATRAVYHAPSQRVLSLGYVFTLEDIARNRVVARWKASCGEESFTALAMSPDGKTGASGSLTGLVYLWDIDARRGLPKAVNPKQHVTDAPEGKPVRILRSGKEMIEWLAYSPDSASLAAGDYAGVVRVFDAKSGRVLRVLKKGGHDDGAFSPDGELLGTAEHGITLWDMKGRAVRRFSGGSALCFVSSRVLATVGGGALTLWDPKTGKRLATTKMPKSNGRTLSVSSMGPLLVTTGPVALFSMS